MRALKVLASLFSINYSQAAFAHRPRCIFYLRWNPLASNPRSSSMVWFFSSDVSFDSDWNCRAGYFAGAGREVGFSGGERYGSRGFEGMARGASAGSGADGFAAGWIDSRSFLS